MYESVPVENKLNRAPIPVQFFPSLVGERKLSKHEQVKDEGVAQFPVHQVLTPHLV